MTVNPWPLLIALVLLWFPRRWLRFGGRLWSTSRHKNPLECSGRDASDQSLIFKKEVSNPRNWVDFLRATTGGLAIWYFCFELTPDGAKAAGMQIFVIQSAVFVIAVLIQTLRISQGRLALIAPVFFFLGLSFGFLGWQAALFACVAIWILNQVLPGPTFFLLVFAVLELGFGLLLPGAPLSRVILAASLTTLPIILSGVMKRRMVRVNKPLKKVRV